MLTKKPFGNLFHVKEEVVLVTGAAGQLGSAIVRTLLGCGVKVVATDMNDELLNQTATQQQWKRESTLLLECDISQRRQLVEVLHVAVSHFGGVTSLVANAGVSVFEPFLERSDSSIDHVMNVNLKGSLICIQEFIKARVAQGGKGSVVGIASHYGVVSPDPRIYTDCDRNSAEIYGATKAGIIQMTRYYAVHAAEHHIRVNAVSPGGIRNPLNPQGEDFQRNYSNRCPMGRMGEAEEVAGAVVFLLSPAASYINGHNLVVDGGFTCW